MLPRFVGARLDLIIGVEIGKRLIEHRVVGAQLRCDRDRAGRRVAIRHIDAEAEVLLDPGKKAGKARMRRRRNRSDDVKRAAVPCAHLLTARLETKIDHGRHRALRSTRLFT